MEKAEHRFKRLQVENLSAQMVFTCISEVGKKKISCGKHLPEHLKAFFYYQDS